MRGICLWKVISCRKSITYINITVFKAFHFFFKAYVIWWSTTMREKIIALLHSFLSSIQLQTGFSAADHYLSFPPPSLSLFVSRFRRFVLFPPGSKQARSELAALVSKLWGWLQFRFIHSSPYFMFPLFFFFFSCSYTSASYSSRIRPSMHAASATRILPPWFSPPLLVALLSLAACSERGEAEAEKKWNWENRASVQLTLLVK